MGGRLGLSWAVNQAAMNWDWTVAETLLEPAKIRKTEQTRPCIIPLYIDYILVETVRHVIHHSKTMIGK